MTTRTTPRALALALTTVTLATGCGKPPAEAPSELNDLSAFLFQHYDDEDTAELVAGIDNLRTFMGTIDLVGDIQDRAFTLTKIEGEALDGLSIPEGASADKQVPVAVAGRSIHGDMAVHREVALEPNQVCIDSDTTKYGGRSFLTDTECFASGACDTLETTTEVRKENLLAKVWYDSFKNYRLLELEDGTEVMIARSWLEEVFPADSGGNSWDQSFSVDVYIPDPAEAGTMQRFVAMWSSITVGGIGDDFYSSLVRDGIDQSFLFADEFASGTITACKEDRDRPYDRPQ